MKVKKVKTELKRSESKAESGFIVHPFETSDGSYDASYGNHNKTQKKFRTLRDAKAYLKSRGVKSANYDMPSGVKRLNLTKSPKKKTVVRRKKVFGGFGLRMKSFF